MNVGATITAAAAAVVAARAFGGRFFIFLNIFSRYPRDWIYIIRIFRVCASKINLTNNVNETILIK